MQRLSFALLFAIVLLAGFTVRLVFDRPVASGPVAGHPADIETAHAFYRALNEVLSGGDTDALSALLAGSFMEHEVGSGAMQPAEAFLSDVQTIARLAPGMRLEVDSIEPLGSSLIVQVHQSRAAPAQVAGLAIEPSMDGGSFDVLRIERGKVVDRWTAGFDGLEVATFEDAALFTSGSIGVTPVLKRLVVPAGAQLSWKSGAQAMLFVEAGSARLATIVSGQEATTVTLDPGMALSIPAAANHRLRAAGGEDVSVLLYSAPANPPNNSFAPAGSLTNAAAPAMDVFDEADAGVTQAMLWQGNLAEVGWDRVHHGGRLVLPAGEAVDLVPGPRTLVLVSIDRGSIELSAPGGTVSTLGPVSLAEESGGAAGIDAAHGAFIDADGRISLRNTSGQPVVVLLIALDGTPMGVARGSA